MSEEVKTDKEGDLEMTDSYSAVSEIMTASDSMGLFGPIGRRAAVKYRRLMRSVHPDVDPSPAAAEAAARLNALWEDWQVNYGSKPASATSHAPAAKTETVKVLATSESTLFKTAWGWLDVANKPEPAGSTARVASVPVDGLSELHGMVAGSPVWVPSPSDLESIMIAQKDGPHSAIKVKTGGSPESMADGWPLAALGAVDGRDLAWILKRLVFLGSATAAAGVVFPDLGERVIVRPSTHQLGVVSFVGVEEASEIDVAHDPMASVMEAFVKLASTAASTDTRKLTAFARGCMVASRPDGGELMRELDSTLQDLYGPASYHEMEDPAGH